MSKSKQLDKEPAYCSKCNILCDGLYCPVCRREKIKRHCRKFDKPSALHWHLRHEHSDFINLKFSYDDAIQALNGVSKALGWGMLE